MENNEEKRVIWGFENSMQVAAEVWREGNHRLLNGELLFAYRNTDERVKSGLCQVIVVANLENVNGTLVRNRTYGVSLTTSSYSAILPKMPLVYLREELASDLASYKIDKGALAVFEQIISEIE